MAFFSLLLHRHAFLMVPAIFSFVVFMVFAAHHLGSSWSGWFSLCFLGFGVLGLFLSWPVPFLGIFVRWFRWRPSGMNPPVFSGTKRTAVLIPCYQENMDHVLAGVDAMARENGGYHFYILSDTQDPLLQKKERDLFQRFLVSRPPFFFFQQRKNNWGKKVGNLMHWYTDYGRHYDFMIVLDADSYMSPKTLKHLIGRMESNPQVGLIQTMFYQTGSKTLFGRMQAFSTRLGGPLHAAGLDLWQGPKASYWGHNAIIRKEAFDCLRGMPILLSHDIIEAAMISAKGWEIWLDPIEEGSLEGVPPNFLSWLIREQRWCAGNMQHIAVLWNARKSFHLASIIHIGWGILQYLSPIFLTLSAIIAWIGGVSYPVFFLIMILSMMILPRLLYLIDALIQGRREEFGGWKWMIMGVLVETLCTMLLSPLVASAYCVFVVSFFFGKEVEWGSQSRVDTDLPWKKVFGSLYIFAALAFCLTFVNTVWGWPWALFGMIGVFSSIPLCILSSKCFWSNLFMIRDPYGSSKGT